ncbi:AMP-binding protein, partial [Pseudomonas sp. SIMBA_077]
ALRAYGAEKGDRIAMFAQPTPDYLAVFLGAILAGAVPSPINHNFKQTELSAYLAYLDPRLTIFDLTTQEVVAAVTSETTVPWRALQIDA